MSDIKPYEPTSPGDLITADLFNRVQVMTREDILAQVRKAIDALKEVERAGNAARLEGKSAAQLSDAIIDRALRELPARTGYRAVYKRLQPDEPAIIQHDLMAYPLVDVYELQRFPAVVSSDGKQWLEYPHFFAYHDSEKRIHHPTDGTLVLIEESRGPVFKHTLQSMLELYHVPYDELSTMGDVMTELWKAMFSGTNDSFDETSTGASAWFDRCCGERRTVESLKRGREWDNLFMKQVPRKTINSITPMRPLGVEVVHYDMNKLGLLRTDFARLTVASVERVVRAADENSKAAAEEAKVAGGGGGVIAHQVAAGASPPDERMIVELARHIDNAAAAEAASRGHPEPYELHLMVLLKV
jgi:hypothetical protein